MWIFTSKGMVSCVKHSKKAYTILVRARAKEHIEAFIEPLTKEGHYLNGYFYLADCDYNHRIEISSADFSYLVHMHIEQINYPDFKGSIPKGIEFTTYSLACHDVWAVMNRFKHTMIRKAEGLPDKCDGKHGGLNPCADPECWIRDEPFNLCEGDFWVSAEEQLNKRLGDEMGVDSE